MGLWSAMGKLSAIWSRYGERIEATMDIWLQEDGAPAAPAKPSADVVDELRAVVGNAPMTPGERDKFNRVHNIHARTD